MSQINYNNDEILKQGYVCQEDEILESNIFKELLLQKK